MLISREVAGTCSQASGGPGATGLGRTGVRAGASLSPPWWLWTGDGNKAGLREELRRGGESKLRDREGGRAGPRGLLQGLGELAEQVDGSGGGVGPILPFRREREVRKPLEFFLGVLQ